MLFNSSEFIFVFLPFAVLLDYIGAFMFLDEVVNFPRERIRLQPQIVGFDVVLET